MIPVMYLRRLEEGQRVVQRCLLGLAQGFALRAAVGVVKILMYRPEPFGAPFCRVGQPLMRGRCQDPLLRTLRTVSAAGETAMP